MHVERQQHMVRRKRLAGEYCRISSIFSLNLICQYDKLCESRGVSTDVFRIQFILPVTAARVLHILSKQSPFCKTTMSQSLSCQWLVERKREYTVRNGMLFDSKHKRQVKHAHVLLRHKAYRLMPGLLTP